MLGSSAALKDQPASPQPSPRPDGERKSICEGITPRSVGMIAQTAAVRQWPCPPPNDHDQTSPMSTETYCNMSPETANSAPRLQTRCGIANNSSTHKQTYFHTAGRRMTLPCVPTGIFSGSWHMAGRSRGMFLYYEAAQSSCLLIVGCGLKTMTLFLN